MSSNPSRITLLDKSPLDKFLNRFYRLKVFKYGQVEDRFVLIEDPIDIHDLVVLAKKWCNSNKVQFMNIRPLFEVLKDG